MKTKRTFIEVFGKSVEIDGRFIRVARLDGDQFTFPDDPELVLNYLRKCGTRIDLFTFLQKLAEKSPKYSYPMELDNLAVLPVSTFDNWWATQLDNKTRNMVRKAQKKTVETREVPFDDAFLQGMCEIYNECPIRQGRRFPHYGMSLTEARKYAGTFLERSIFIGAFLGERMIGFIKLVTDETRTHACTLHILSMLQHRDKAPTNALIAQAVRSCADRGISYLVYDRFSYGKKQEDNLSHFKEANGFRRFDLPRYYVPLSLIGWAAFRLGLHRKFVDFLPETIMVRLREILTAWHTRKLRMSTDAS